MIFVCFLLSQEKNPQVSLMMTDGFVNKCGNNSNGVIVLAAGTPAVLNESVQCYTCMDL